MKYPLDSMYITSKYGMRNHPIFNYNKMHLGIDLRARTGTKTYSILDGVVKVSKHQVNSKGKSVGLGSYIVIEHELNGEKFCTMVCHLHRRSVKVGDKVKEGQVIGLTGNSGSSGAPHLHFGIHWCPASKFFSYQNQKSGIHTYREFKYTIDPDKFLKQHMLELGGETVSERVNVKIKASGKKIEDCEKNTVEKLKLYVDPFEYYEEKVYYSYCGYTLKYSTKRDSNVVLLQKALNKLGERLDEDGYFGRGTVKALKSRTGAEYVDKATAQLINSKIFALVNKPVEEKPEPKPIDNGKIKKNSNHHRGKYYNHAIPQLKYRKRLKFGKGRIFKSTEVKYWQRALQALGYYLDYKVDGWFGTNCINETVKFQQDYGLPIDNSLDMLDYYKMNQALINNIDRYADTKYDLDNWGIGINSKYVGVAVKVHPNRLGIVKGDKAGSSYTEDNLMTSSYQWFYNGKMYKYGVCMDNGKVLQDGQVHSKPVTVLYSKGDKHFDVKKVLHAHELGSGVRWADNGLMMYPDANEYKTGGFSPKYLDVLRKTARPMHMKYDGELYFVVMPDMSNKEAYQYGMMIVAGWMVSEDAGGSTLLKIRGKWYWKTTRRLYQLISF